MQNKLIMYSIYTNFPCKIENDLAYIIKNIIHGIKIRRCLSIKN